MTITIEPTEPVPAAPPPSPPAARRRGLVRRFFRRLFDDIKAFGELRNTPYGLGPALIFAFSGFFSRLDTAAFNVAGPDIVRETNIKVSSILDVTSFIVTFSVLAALFLGWWADRHRRVPLFVAGTVTSGGFAMLSAAGNSTVTLGTPRVLDEVGNTAADVPYFSLVADYYPPETRGRIFAFMGTLSYVGRLAAVLVVGTLVTSLGFRTSFVIIGVPIVVLGIAAAFVLREPIRGYFERRAAGVDEDVAMVEDEPVSFGEGWRSTFAVRTVRRFFAGEIIIYMAEFPVSLLLPFFLSERYGLSAAERGYVYVPAFAVGIYGGILGGSLADRLLARNPGRLLAVFGLFDVIFGIGVLGYSLQPPLWLFILFLCVQSFGSSLVGPAAKAVYAQVIPPAIRSQGIQITQLAALPAGIFGIQIGSMIFENYGYAALFVIAAPIAIIGGLVQMSAAGFFESDRRNTLAQARASEDWRQAKLANADKMLVCRSVDVEYDGVQVLFDVDFDVDEGDIIALLGTNGAGKSTLLRAISGSQEASGGGIVFNGRDITHMPPHEVAARGVVHMPGGRGVFPGLTVRENLLLGNWLTDDEAVVRERIQEVLTVFPGLRERLDVAAGALSGGEQQQVSLAQAFLMQPKLLMIDELTLGLSPAVVAELLEVVREIHRRGVTIIIVEQSVNVALALAERAVFMEKGEVRFVGKTADLLSRPDILRAVYVKGTGALTDGAPAGAQRGAAELRRLELADRRPVLELDHITKRYGGIVAVDDISFDVREGQVVGLIGPNGSGKTTLFDIISGFVPADAGTVRIGEVDVSSLVADARVRAGLVRRFQDARLFPSLTVFETLLIALEQRLEVKSTVLNALAVPQARRAERRLRLRAEHLIELLGLEAYRDKFIKELSTGLRRIVDLACVLAAEPQVLLLDEPSSGIAQAEAEGLAPLLRRVQFETGCTILLIEHDMPLVSGLADELIAMDQGRLLIRGTPEVVLNDNAVIESYLGGSEAAVNRSGRLA